MFVVPAGVLACEEKLTTLVPLTLREDGAKLALTPAGSPLALKETLPVRPPTKVTLIVLVGFVFGGKETAAGEAEIEKFGSAVIVSVRGALSTVVPLVPDTVTVAAPTVAVLEAVNVSVLPADPDTELGLKLAVTPVGRPLTPKVTAPVKPLIEDTVMLLAAVVPCITVAPEPDMPKPGVVED